MELLVQAPDTPPTLHCGSYHSFPRSFSEILPLALAPLAFFIITAQSNILGSFEVFFFFPEINILPWPSLIQTS